MELQQIGIERQILIDVDQPVKKYRYLVIGRSGNGKSLLCQNLTGDQKIQASSSIKSCTQICTVYQSNDHLNSERGYQIEVIDTPGLDANDININQSIAKMLQVLTNIKTINGVLFVISHSSKRDQTMGWFIKFLIYLFKIEKLNTAIIPILTNYDKEMYTDEDEIQQNKSQRQQCIKRELEPYVKSPITFWKNHIDWVNIGKQKWKPEHRLQMQQLFKENLQKLIDRSRNTQLQLKQTLKKFSDDLLQKIIKRYETLRRQNEQIKTKEVKMPDFQSTINVPDQGISYWHLTPAVGWIVFIIRLFMDDPIHQKKSLSSTKKQAFGQILDKIHCALFNQQISKRVSIRRHTPFKQKALPFFFNGNGFISLEILQNHYKNEQGYMKRTVTQLNSIQIKSKIKQSDPPKECLNCQKIKKQQQQYIEKYLQMKEIRCRQNCQVFNCELCQQIKIMVFIDKNQYKEENRHYQFSNITIKRPCDQYYNDLFLNIIAM